MKKSSLIVVALVLCVTCCKAEMSPEERRETILSNPMVQWDNYAFDPSRPLSERIGPSPAFLTEHMAKADRAEDYESYTPTAREKELLLRRIAELPPGMRKAFKERLVGIYFIKNFMGNGLTTWIAGPSDTVYTAMIINPAVFSKSLSATLTGRERSLFKNGENVRVDCGEKLSGLVYALLHEGTHVYDYTQGLTPYVEEVLIHAYPRRYSREASWDVWRSLSVPVEDADFPYREKLGFYGLDGAPVIEGREAPDLYEQLGASPFVSLYGSRTWAEDAAELVVFYHVTRTLKQPCSIHWSVDGRSGQHEPMGSERVRERARKVYTQLQ